ncbi:hypothetical protein [Tenacibaculum ovolyticum]|uniref:hypothetical protein n=1 Tax=Tenacibaculum ovolyticum TaxID=104270 RepID=UPI003BAD945B
MKEYFPKKYLSVKLLDEILSRLFSGVDYEIEEDLPDGIEVFFMKNSIYFSEYAEGEILADLYVKEGDIERKMSLADAISIAGYKIVLSEEYPIKKHIPFASKEKVSNQIENILYIIYKYINYFLEGELN